MQWVTNGLLGTISLTVLLVLTLLKLPAVGLVQACSLAYRIRPAGLHYTLWTRKLFRSVNHNLPGRGNQPALSLGYSTYYASPRSCVRHVSRVFIRYSIHGHKRIKHPVNLEGSTFPFPPLLFNLGGFQASEHPTFCHKTIKWFPNRNATIGYSFEKYILAANRITNNYSLRSPMSAHPLLVMRKFMPMVLSLLHFSTAPHLSTFPSSSRLIPLPSPFLPVACNCTQNTVGSVLNTVEMFRFSWSALVTTVYFRSPWRWRGCWCCWLYLLRGLTVSQPLMMTRLVLVMMGWWVRWHECWNINSRSWIVLVNCSFEIS